MLNPRPDPVCGSAGTTNPIVCVEGRREGDRLRRSMLRQVRFQCGTCGDHFVEWHDEALERGPLYCVNCGEPIDPGSQLEATEATEATEVIDATPVKRPERTSNRSLGVIRGQGDGFRDTLPGLRVASPHASEAAPESSGKAPPAPPPAPPSSARATSSAPLAGPSRPPTVRRTSFQTALAALLIGFIAGIPVALLGERSISRLANPAGYARRELSERLAAVSAAIDDGKLDAARAQLNQLVRAAPTNDHRVGILRARLALGMILVKREADAERELQAVPQQTGIHPSTADLRRIFDAWFAQSGNHSVGNGVGAAGSMQPTAALGSARAKVAAKPVVTKREILTFARDRQHRLQLDDAQRLYEAVLRHHPADAEARCGLAEVQLLRGGVADGAELFSRALKDNANYAPAWVGLADTDWLQGHPKRAACRYQAVVDHFPAAAYPPYILQRIEQAKAASARLPSPPSGADATDGCED